MIVEMKTKEKKTDENFGNNKNELNKIKGNREKYKKKK